MTRKQKKSTKIRTRFRLVRVERTELTGTKRDMAKMQRSNLKKRKLPRLPRRELRKKEPSPARKLHL